MYPLPRHIIAKGLVPAGTALHNRSSWQHIEEGQGSGCWRGALKDGEGGGGGGEGAAGHQQAELHSLCWLVKCQHEVALCFLALIAICGTQEAPNDISVQCHCVLSSHITLSLQVTKGLVMNQHY